MSNRPKLKTSADWRNAHKARCAPRDECSACGVSWHDGESYAIRLRSGVYEGVHLKCMADDDGVWGIGVFIAKPKVNA